MSLCALRRGELKYFSFNEILCWWTFAIPLYILTECAAAFRKLQDCVPEYVPCVSDTTTQAMAS